MFFTNHGRILTVRKISDGCYLHDEDEFASAYFVIMPGGQVEEAISNPAAMHSRIARAA